MSIRRRRAGSDQALETGPAKNRHNGLKLRRHGLTALIITGGLLVPFITMVTRAEAASFTVTSLSATISGQSVTANAAVKAVPATTATAYGVCVRNAAWGNADFPLWANVSLTTGGVTYASTKTFSSGTYAYGVCILEGGVWSFPGTSKTFVVGGATTPTSPSSPTTPSTSPSDSAMPVGNLPGWTQVLAEDFTTNAGFGTFESVYGSRWFAYRGADTSRRGTYNPSTVLSASNGLLDWYVHAENGNRQVAAIVPKNPSTGWGQAYGRYSVRFRSDLLAEYKMAFLLWPDSDNWGEGEVDFPESTSLYTGGKMYANLYAPGNTTTRTPVQGFKSQTSIDAGGTGWHTATIEWTPGRLVFYLDGSQVGATTSGVPSARMHWVLQVETRTEGSLPSPSAGHFQVDWATMYAYTP